MIAAASTEDWLREAHGIRPGDRTTADVAQAINTTHANIERAVRKVAPQPGALFDLRAASFDILCRGGDAAP
ncbi:hypothetical protein GCM10007276_18880 [Agaricicola taiwanensis]|uniref:Uncharacterized protein n=1 Tax=Agaricicola taiwanensis TaxID=591372 RepID=A0A8J2VP97_9RHOB|nr:hypothetical protein GCM10007276_18880 [Agaricicola taiwanensis]